MFVSLDMANFTDEFADTLLWHVALKTLPGVFSNGGIENITRRIIELQFILRHST